MKEQNEHSTVGKEGRITASLTPINPASEQLIITTSFTIAMKESGMFPTATGF